MKILHSVSTKEVKRAFVIPTLIRNHKHTKYLRKMSEEEFIRSLATAKKKGLAMSEKQLDAVIFEPKSKGVWKTKRLNGYNNSDWYVAEVSTSEIGVWRRAGQLPVEWTNNTLKETAKNVAHGLSIHSKRIRGRAQGTIGNMLSTNVQKLQKESYLLPIVFASMTGTNGRAWLRQKMKGDIDDGCMRSIALAISGKKRLRVYFGVPKGEPVSRFT